jgi:hypothetical protein
MNHIFARGHQPVPGVEIEWDGRPHVNTLRAQTGTCQGGESRYQDELL